MLAYTIGVGIALFIVGCYFIYKHLRKKWNNKKEKEKKGENEE